MAIVKGPWNQDGFDRLTPFISDKYRSHTADNKGITITEYLVKNPSRIRISINNFKYRLSPQKDPIITGGTLTGFSASAKSGSKWITWASVNGVNASATSLYSAAMSKDTSDDRKFFETVFKGNDRFDLSDQGDIVRGYAGNDKIFGKGGNDLLDGGLGDDLIDGGLGNDLIIGGGGKDTLIGGGGVDKFIYRTVGDSGVGKTRRDVITDFKGTQGEKIDLSAIDAYTKTPGNQTFTYIGSKGFTGTKGEVRFSGGVLQMNTGTDKVADMEIALTGVTSFSQNFLIL